ncbi:fructosamine kinase family protein [Aestuariispira ectoiniformans]|uniref:fructosamine kinase family protein n=1 Tax=Aestuariispira ectoiniformans TaxID=2775080 RepID=UPI00223BAA16|nr:fructosamine kinase family protein [Aestuariispira ectoiniformans]
MQDGHRRRIEEIRGSQLARADYLPGGCVGEVWKLTFEDGGQAVAKTANGEDTLDIEAYMLRYLADHSGLPVPHVIEATPDLLLMDYVESGGSINVRVQEDAADILAKLHDVTAPKFGHERDTLIGPLHQPNLWTDRWIDFFRDHRLLYLGRAANDAGQLPPGTMARLERLCGRLDSWLSEPTAASLIHGDIWGGNVLAKGDRIAAFIDPAIYHADPEIELAYTTLFHTFGQRFFDRYQEHRPLSPNFFDERVALYHLYPLLVHARLFGGGYGSQVDSILRRFVG